MQVKQFPQYVQLKQNAHGAQIQPLQFPQAVQEKHKLQPEHGLKQPPEVAACAGVGATIVVISGNKSDTTPTAPTLRTNSLRDVRVCWEEKFSDSCNR